MKIDLKKLSQEIINGKKIDKETALLLLDADLDTLCQEADKIRAAFMANKVNLCSIISGIEGRCSEDCKFCAQSGHNKCNCDVHSLLPDETVIAAAKANANAGVKRFAMVNSGRCPSAADFERIISIYEKMSREVDINLCCSLGFLTNEQFILLKNAGVKYIHCNLESSRNYFEKVCSTHSYDEKIENIKRAKAAGLNVCSGGIIGMGESWMDRIDMAFELRALQIKSIPVNTLVPIPGTPFENIERISENDILRCIAIYRFINPDADIRLAGGRILMKDNGKKAFSCGASASITGNMLTTSGATIKEDMTMLKELGRIVV